MILVFDGPEKAGKTTLIGAVRSALISRGVNVVIRKWGPVFPDDRVYSPALRGDVDNANTVTIWDRSWAAEAVCAKLLGRERRLAKDWFLGEWLHSRVVQTVGARFMVTGDLQHLASLRDETDIPVNPSDELHEYIEYGERFHWMPIFNKYTHESLMANVDKVLFKMDLLDEYSRGLYPPSYVGPQHAKVVFVGPAALEHRSTPGAWIPFTSRMTTMMARDIGIGALKYGWTTVNGTNVSSLDDREVLVIVGDDTDPLLPEGPRTILRISHPANVYRFDSGGLISVVRGGVNDPLFAFPNATKKDGQYFFTVRRDGYNGH